MTDRQKRERRAEEVVKGVQPVPARPARWRRWCDFEDLHRGPADPDWRHDRQLAYDELCDPWNGH